MTDEQRHPDDCPHCGTRVEAHGSYGIGARDEGVARQLTEMESNVRLCIRLHCEFPLSAFELLKRMFPTALASEPQRARPRAPQRPPGDPRRRWRTQRASSVGVASSPLDYVSWRRRATYSRPV
jgi:hypothetical protein